MRRLCRWTWRLSLSSSLSVVVSLSSSDSLVVSLCRRLSLSSSDSLVVSLSRHLGHLVLCHWTPEGRIKRHEAASKKRTVVWTDQETMAISGRNELDRKQCLEMSVCHKLIVNDLERIEMSLTEMTCSQANETAAADEGTTRPTGVKAAKARGKKPMVDAKELSQFQTMWTIKQQD
ncbi:hypothetical protein F2Q70_00000638 [Brassica cretica]|uniref:Uncharacterized protein n=1 Tax=Brassica cretica TaxID=69181 RepID=A0A8S9J0S1_BRACR|nr:hypothetical protein F2Q70_00000638 [Brassica cretica]